MIHLGSMKFSKTVKETNVYYSNIKEKIHTAACLFPSFLSPVSHSSARFTSNSTYSAAKVPDDNASMPIALAAISITPTSLEGSKLRR